MDEFQEEQCIRWAKKEKIGTEMNCAATKNNCSDERQQRFKSECFKRNLKESEIRSITVSELIAGENEREGETRDDCEPLSL